MSSASSPRATTIAIVAMGGEGGGVLADWIVDVAEHGGYCAQTTSVPGVAQRTGSTIYYIEIFPSTDRDTVLALMPVPGELDVVLASELMEAGRAVQRGLVTPDRTTLIASTNRVYSMTEKTAIGDGQVDAAKLLEICAAAAKRFVRADFAALAEQKRSAISAVLFGALAATASLPFAREIFEESIRRSGVGVESSLAAFAAGYAAATNPRELEAGEQMTAAPNAGVKLQPLVAQVEREFPPSSHSVLLAGVARLADFQDVRYAAEYLHMLGPVRDLENHELLNETARYLALWMSYEDAPRVADLKIRRTRFDRVHQESQASAARLVQIQEFLHPRIEELADVMPAAFGRWLLRNPQARRLLQRITKKGMVLKTTSLSGFLQLYMVSGLRRWRRKSLRFHEEHMRIAEWLQALSTIAASDTNAALEVAQFPHVLKGYGDTYVNGRKKFDTLMQALPRPAEELHQLHTAALADEDGTMLAQTLLGLQHGVTAQQELQLGATR